MDNYTSADTTAIILSPTSLHTRALTRALTHSLTLQVNVDEELLADWTFACAFRVLSLENLLTIFEWALQEKNIVFHSENLGLLSAVVYVNARMFANANEPCLHIVCHFRVFRTNPLSVCLSCLCLLPSRGRVSSIPYIPSWVRENHQHFMHRLISHFSLE